MSHQWARIVLAGALQAGSARAQTEYFVDGGCGDDSWSGLSSVCAAPDGPKASINSAIVAAATGDQITVAPGVYVEQVNFRGKQLVLRSSSGPENTVIDGAMTLSPLVRFNNNEAKEVVFEGFTLTNATTAVRGGAMEISAASSPTIRRCRFVGNEASAFGGAVQIRDGSSPVIEQCEFFGNASIDGGAIWIGQPGTDPTLFECHFEQNQGADGGAIFIDDLACPKLVDCSFVSNQASLAGGAVLIQGASGAWVEQCWFMMNSADTGGAVWVAESFTDPTFVRCDFERNHASNRGGAIRSSSNAQSTVRRCTFVLNTADGSGAAYHGETTEFRQCLFWDNECQWSGVADCSGGERFLNCTFVGNTTYGLDEDGSGIWFNGLNGQPLIVANSILWNNQANGVRDEVAQISFREEHRSLVEVGYSCIDGLNSLDDGTSIGTSPLFVDEQGGDFHLTDVSPCLDAGNSLQSLGLMSVDLDGLARFADAILAPDTGAGYKGVVIDMGVYEFPGRSLWGSIQPGTETIPESVAPFP